MTGLLLTAALAQTTTAPPPPPPPPDAQTHYYELSFTVGPVLGMSLPGVDEPGLLQMANLFVESRQGKGVGIGLISGRKAFQKPLKEGVALLNAIQDVYLCRDVTVA